LEVALVALQYTYHVTTECSARAETAVFGAGRFPPICPVGIRLANSHHRIRCIASQSPCLPPGGNPATRELPRLKSYTKYEVNNRLFIVYWAQRFRCVATGPSYPGTLSRKKDTKSKSKMSGSAYALYKYEYLYRVLRIQQ